MTKFNASCQNPYARPASYESPTLEEILTEEELQEFKANQELEEQIREESRLSALEVLPEKLSDEDFLLDDMPDDSEAEGLYRKMETADGYIYVRRI